MREVAGKMLQLLGYNVSLCEDGLDAVEFYRRHWKEIDLVILDLVMPKMGAKKTFAEMKKINPDVKVILASGYSVNGEAQSILNEGVLGFVQKPFRMNEFSKIISDLFK